MKHAFIIAALLVVVIASMNFTRHTDDEVIAYPENYRDWTHVKTYIVQPKNPAFKFIGGFNHVYANEKAMEGFRTGFFPNGAVIVSDVIKADEDTLNIREGLRDHIDVMERDSIKFNDAGGWRFETFKGDTHDVRMLTPVTRVACNNCHKKTKDFVFGELRK